ncbi:hypothetical protein D3C76_1339800 [compost metagenome]
MGQVIGELRELLHTVVEAVQHEVDALRQFAQLLRHVHHRQSMIKILGRHHRRHFAKLAHRSQASLHRHPGTQADEDQQPGQRYQRRAQIGPEQCLVVGIVHRQQHRNTGAILEANQL